MHACLPQLWRISPFCSRCIACAAAQVVAAAGSLMQLGGCLWQGLSGKKMQLSLTGFMEKNTPRFMKELWELLLSAQANPSGIPQQFLDEKAAELRAKKVSSRAAGAGAGILLCSRGGSHGVLH